MKTHQRIELMPGVWLRPVQTDKFKSSFFSISLMAPLHADTAAEYAILPSVLRRGCTRCPDMQAISVELDSLYGGMLEPAVRKKGETQCIGLVASFLDDSLTPGGTALLDDAAALLGDILLRPVTQDGVFSAAYLEGERTNLINRIRAQVNDKRRYAMYRLIREMCDGEAFGTDVLGDEEHAAAITPASLWARYQTLLATAPIEIYYCGSAAPERVADALRRALADLPRGERDELPVCEIRLHAEREPRYVEDAMDVTQGKLCMGFRTGGMSVWEEEYPALILCNALFGGTTLSKLFLNVRERMSLCYYASSMLEKMKGLVLVSSGIEFDKFQTARDEILAQLDCIRRGEIEPAELEGVRRTVVGALRASLDSQSALEDFWLGQAAAELEWDLEALTARIEPVTAQQVAQAAALLELDTVYFLRGQEVTA